MSFNCADCGETKRRGEMVVRETRTKTYVGTIEVRGRKVETPVGTGFETVREERVCENCLPKYKAQVIDRREAAVELRVA